MSWSSVVTPTSRRTDKVSGEAASNSADGRVGRNGNGKESRRERSKPDARGTPGESTRKQRENNTKKKNVGKPTSSSSSKPPLHRLPTVFAAAPANAWGRVAETKERLGVVCHEQSPEKSTDDALEPPKVVGVVEENPTTCDLGDEVDEEAARAAFSSLAGGLDTLQDPVLVEPVGIENPGNVCFANSVIQALLGCDLFCRLLFRIRNASEVLDASSDSYPVLKAMSDIARELQFTSSTKKFSTLPPLSSSRRPQRLPRAVRVSLVTKLVHESFNTRYKGEQRTRRIEQEDAHEFLHCLLDGMHKELLRLTNAENSKGGSSFEDDVQVSDVTTASRALAALRVDDSASDDNSGEWLTQSGKRAVKQQVVTTEVMSSTMMESRQRSAVSELFEGMQATSIASRGNPPSVTMHPFLVVEIPLYDPSVDTLEGSISSVMATETISGYRPAGGTGAACEASKSERFQSLPEILVLHMMRFQFSGSSEKLNKNIRYGTRLRVKAGWMMAGSSNRDRRAEYELVATISHHGESIAQGHFTANVRHPNEGNGESDWVNLNDEIVRPIREDRVLHDAPYLLFYRRL